jgi:predicted negative regulator of RcsB-dependent stress response
MQKRYEEAMGYITKAVENDSLHSSVILEHAGDINAMNGQIDEAVRLWQEAMKSDSNNKILNRKIRRKKYIK